MEYFYWIRLEVIRMLNTLKAKMKTLKQDLTALYLAYRHPGVPWYAKLFTALILGYALSPIDLIPDFIPILGYLDDLLLIPLGITLALKMIPKPVMEECRRKAAEMDKNTMGNSWAAAILIILIWLLLLWVIVKRFI